MERPPGATNVSATATPGGVATGTTSHEQAVLADSFTGCAEEYTHHKKGIRKNSVRKSNFFITQQAFFKSAIDTLARSIFPGINLKWDQ